MNREDAIAILAPVWRGLELARLEIESQLGKIAEPLPPDLHHRNPRDMEPHQRVALRKLTREGSELMEAREFLAHWETRLDPLSLAGCVMQLGIQVDGVTPRTVGWPNVLMRDEDRDKARAEARDLFTKAKAREVAKAKKPEAA